MRSPCRDCPKKGCGNHANCEQYLEFQEQRKFERKKKFDDLMVDGYMVDSVMQSKRVSRNYKKKR